MSDEKRPFYNRFSWAYDLVIDAPVGARCDFIDRVIKNNHFTAPTEILDAGCGTGSYAIELTKRGYCVTGVDLSPAQLKQAQLKAQETQCNLELVKDDLLDLRIDKQFDLILCRGVLNDFVTDDQRIRVFQSLSNALKPDGVLLFDIREWNGSIQQKTTEPATRKTISTSEGELNFTSTTNLDYETRSLKIHECHKLKTSIPDQTYEWDLVMRCWTIDEIDQILGEVGLFRTDLYGDWNESIEPFSTERLIIVARNE